MERKVMIKLFIFIIVIAVLSYAYGLNTGKEEGIKLGSEKNKYKDLFLIDPLLGNNSKFWITQELVGNVKSIDNNKIMVDVNGNNATVSWSITTIIQNCEVDFNAPNCKYGNLDDIIGKNVKIRAEGVSGSYYASVVSY